MTSVTAWIHLLILAVVCAIGDALFKKASVSESPYLTLSFLAGSLIYATCGFSWVVVLQSSKLAVAGVVFSVAWSVVLTALGFFLFRETLSLREACGLVLGLAAIYLLTPMQ